MSMIIPLEALNNDLFNVHPCDCNLTEEVDG